MRVVASVVAPAPPDAVFEWWTDYGEPGERARVHHGLGASTREVLRREGDRLVLRDRFAGAHLDHDVRVRASERRVDENYVGGVGLPYRSTWRFEPADGGRATRITREFHASVPGPGFLEELGAPAVRRALEKDMEAHVREFVSERRP